MQHPDIKQLDQAKRIKVHARVRPTQLNYSWFGEYPMILSRQSLGLLPIRARCDCRSQLSRPWTFWYSIYSYLYVYFFQGDSRMALMMQSNVKDTYYWESLRYKYWIIYWEMAKKLWQTVQVIEALDLGGIFLQIWVVDVDGDSSFDWGKTLGPSKPVFLGDKMFPPLKSGKHYFKPLFMAWAFFSIPTMFGSVIFHGQKERALEIRRFIQVSTKNSSHQLLGCEKFIRNQPITILGFVVTSKTRTKKSRNNLESAGECYDGPVWGYQCPSSFHCVPQGLSISCLWCFQWTSNCINTFYAHLCNCRGLPWRGSFKMTGKRKAGRRCCAGSSLRAPADAEHLVAIENSPKKKTACCFAWGCFFNPSPNLRFSGNSKDTTRPARSLAFF